jgi:hypothetical protein
MAAKGGDEEAMQKIAELSGKSSGATNEANQ